MFNFLKSAWANRANIIAVITIVYNNINSLFTQLGAQVGKTAS